MTALAVPFIEDAQLASAALAEAKAAAAGGDKEAVAFARNCLATSMEHIRGLARRYGATREARDALAGVASPRAIISDPAFRSEAEKLAGQLDGAEDLLGIGGQRLAVALRRWLADQTGGGAAAVVTIADTLVRSQKKKGSH